MNLWSSRWLRSRYLVIYKKSQIVNLEKASPQVNSLNSQFYSILINCSLRSRSWTISESVPSKLRVLSLLVLGLMLGLKPVARATQVTDQSYIWGLPFWTGGLSSRTARGGGYSLSWLRSFGAVDLLLISWLNHFSGKEVLFQAPRHSFFRLGASRASSMLVLLS